MAREHLKLIRYNRLGESERVNKLAAASLAAVKGKEDRKARGVSEYLEKVRKPIKDLTLGNRYISFLVLFPTLTKMRGVSCIFLIPILLLRSNGGLTLFYFNTFGSICQEVRRKKSSENLTFIFVII